MKQFIANIFASAELKRLRGITAEYERRDSAQVRNIRALEEQVEILRAFEGQALQHSNLRNAAYVELANMQVTLNAERDARTIMCRRLIDLVDAVPQGQNVNGSLRSLARKVREIAAPSAKKQEEMPL